MQAIMKTPMIADAIGRLNANPPSLTGLSRKSPTEAPSGRVPAKVVRPEGDKLCVQQ